ncbi:MAG: hypothetical protein LC624_10425 [Halobacteriales archaeon]|nr:hypothetical protein [Halobacteriales archaeon]
MRLGTVIALTALAAAARLLLFALPNVSLTFLVVAVAGLAFGARTGALVGLLAMLVTSAMLGGPTPGALSGALAVGLLGALCGWLRTTGFPGARRTLPQALAAALLGITLQLAFSVAADASGWLLFAALPQGASAGPLLLPLVVGGLLFNLPGAAFQALMFAAALQPVVHALRAAGLADGGIAPSRPTREVLLADLTPSR